MTKEEHYELLRNNNMVYVVKDEQIIIIHSTHTSTPELPFIVTQSVLNIWKTKDLKIAKSEADYNDLFAHMFWDIRSMEIIGDIHQIRFTS